MLLFTADIGNTNMEFGVYENDRLKDSFRMVTNRDLTSDEVGLNICQFFFVRGIRVEDIKDVIITSVVPEVVYSVKNAMRKYLKLTPLIIQDNIKVPIENRYDNPLEVGADRLVNAYAAMKKYGKNLIIIDFGTATTFDVVDGDGAYVGGCIYPGIKISLDALVSRTSKLPRIEIAKPEKVIGRNTVNSIQSGIVNGYSGAVSSIVHSLQQELGVTCTVIATGGLARMIGEQTNVIDVIDRTLILDGLNLIYQEHQGKAE